MLCFGRFRVDRKGHELLLDGEAITLQPKAYDLLLLLIEHRDRLVTKEELLSTLWPGVVVMEGSLQRVVSLLRQVLHSGGCGHFIRTHHRLGYRFVGEVSSLDSVQTSSTNPALAPLVAAGEALRLFAWDEAVAQFLGADRSGASLDTPALLDWARAAQCSGRLAAAVEPLERALRRQTLQGHAAAAARTAVELARVQSERGMGIAAESWLRHAERVALACGDREACGHVAWLQSRFAVFEGRYEESLRFAEEAERIGRACNNPDLIALGLSYQGQASLAIGKVVEGTAMIDEAATLVLGGGVQPLAGGVVYCGVLFASHNRGDWGRAIEWSESFGNWFRRSGINAYPGVCRLHHAEILALRGELELAERELLDSIDEVRLAAAWAEGEACRVLGDIHRLRGDWHEAERSYRRARELGWEPQPGYAELLLAMGEPARAVRSLEVSLMDGRWAVRQRRATLLAVLAVCAARAGDVRKAESTLCELDLCEKEGSSTPAILALRAEAAAEIAFARGSGDDAILRLKDALVHWHAVSAPLISARLQGRLATMLDSMGSNARYHGDATGRSRRPVRAGDNM